MADGTVWLWLFESWEGSMRWLLIAFGVAFVVLTLTFLHSASTNEYRTATVVQIETRYDLAVVVLEDPHTGLRYRVEEYVYYPKVGDQWVIRKNGLDTKWRLYKYTGRAQ